MAKDKDKKQGGQPTKKSRGEGAQMRVMLRKAQHVAKSSGKPALERYLQARPVVKTYFAKDIERLLATTWTPKPETGSN
jgi:hypothetical protein